MDFEQRVIIKISRLKRIKLLDIHHEFTHAFGEETYTFISVEL
jgi:hypothetical protein